MNRINNRSAARRGGTLHHGSLRTPRGDPLIGETFSHLTVVSPEAHNLLDLQNLPCAGADGSRCDAASAASVSDKERVQPRQRRRRPPEGYLTIDDLAALDDADRSTIYRHVKNGSLPAHQWRRRIVVAERDYRNFLAVTPRNHAVDEVRDD